MNGAERDRLTVLETKVDALTADVTEVKGDVKELLAFMHSRMSVTGFVRGTIPFWALGLSALAVGVSVLFR